MNRGQRREGALWVRLLPQSPNPHQFRIHHRNKSPRILPCPGTKSSNSNHGRRLRHCCTALPVQPHQPSRGSQRTPRWFHPPQSQQNPTGQRKPKKSPNPQILRNPQPDSHPKSTVALNYKLPNPTGLAKLESTTHQMDELPSPNNPVFQARTSPSFLHYITEEFVRGDRWT